VAFRLGERGQTTRAQAVDGVSFDIPELATVALVGESGSGKSVTAMSILNLLPDNAERSGVIEYRGRDLLQATPPQLQALRGKEIACVFQDPMTSLNPVFTVGQQLAEPLRRHLGASRRAAAESEVAPQRLGQLRADAEHRVQRSHRILEDAGDLLAAQRLQLAQRGLEQIAAPILDDPRALRVVGQQVEDRHRGDALAGARLADQRDGGVLGDVEADARDGSDLRHRAALAQAERHLEAADAQQFAVFAHHSAPRSLGSSASRQASAISENAVTNRAMNSVAVASCHQ